MNSFIHTSHFNSSTSICKFVNISFYSIPSSFCIKLLYVHFSFFLLQDKSIFQYFSYRFIIFDPYAPSSSTILWFFFHFLYFYSDFLHVFPSFRASIFFQTAIRNYQECCVSHSGSLIIVILFTNSFNHSS